jgi:hypothetical protein
MDYNNMATFEHKNVARIYIVWTSEWWHSLGKYMTKD